MVSVEKVSIFYKLIGTELCCFIVFRIDVEEKMFSVPVFKCYSAKDLNHFDFWIVT